MKKSHEFCSCGRPIHEDNCYKDEIEFKVFIKNEKIKPCPNCGFQINKNKGCNHMICGNPTCRYEFCWLCMKEAKPDHYENSPCAGKQFFDPESFEYQLELNYPCLFQFYMIFKFLLYDLVALILLALPFTLYSLLFFIMIYIEPPENFDKFKSSIKFLIFLSDVFISITIQSIGYMAEGIAWAIIGVIIAIIISLAILDIIILFLRLLFYCCLEDDFHSFYYTKNFITWIINKLENFD